MITVVYCTRNSNPKHKEHLIKSSGLHKNIEVIEIINNGISLTKCYNRGLNEAKNDIVVFCHDDIVLESGWGKKLIKHYENNPEYGILGVAGTKEMSTSGRWWDNRRKMYGRVTHSHEGKTWLSAYSGDIGNDLDEVVLVDGVFFSVQKKRIKKDFDESVEGFHFYDVTFCFDNHLAGVKIGVHTNIKITHMSIGETNEAWEENRVIFAEKYKSKLPVSVKRVLHKGEKLNILIACLKIGGTSPEEIYIENVINTLLSYGCNISLITDTDKKTEFKLKQMGVKLFYVNEPPSFKLGDGKWLLNTNEGQTPSLPNTLYKINDVKFDLIHINSKPLVEHLLRLYTDDSIITTIHSTDRILDEPIKNRQIKKYISINKDITDVLVDGYNIDIDLIESSDTNIFEIYKNII